MVRERLPDRGHPERVRGSRRPSTRKSRSIAVTSFADAVRPTAVDRRRIRIPPIGALDGSFADLDDAGGMGDDELDPIGAGARASTPLSPWSGRPSTACTRALRVREERLADVAERDRLVVVERLDRRVLSVRRAPPTSRATRRTGATSAWSGALGRHGARDGRTRRWLDRGRGRAARGGRACACAARLMRSMWWINRSRACSAAAFRFWRCSIRQCFMITGTRTWSWCDWKSYTPDVGDRPRARVEVGDPGTGHLEVPHLPLDRRHHAWTGRSRARRRRGRGSRGGGSSRRRRRGS